MQYRKRPVVIEADRWLPNDRACRNNAAMIPGAKIDGDKLLIATLEGTMTASPGDWVIRGVHGEYYPCKPDIFEATYEPVPQEKEERCQTADNRQNIPRPPQAYRYE
jgi:hypothetical protein